jgi:ubiquinone/menaquinone biosynthesis C-methylase UbiE
MRKQFNLLFKYNKNVNNLLSKLAEHKLKNNIIIDKYKWKKILLKILEFDDSKIYKILRKMFIQDETFSEERAKHLAFKIVNIIKPFNYTLKTLLDYGCANGTITKELAKQLNINTYFGADIIDIPNPNFNFFLLKDNNLMPKIKDNTIDLINVSMVLHHVKNIHETLAEFKRIISDYGIIIIREHDCKDKSFATFLDILHGLYSLVWSDPIEDPTFVETYQAYYKKYESNNCVLFMSARFNHLFVFIIG